jgi:hypothetical protein
MTFRKRISRRTTVFLSALAVAKCVLKPVHASASTHVLIFEDRKASGEGLAHAFFELLSLTGSRSGIIGTTPEQDAASVGLVAPFLDPAFLLQRASGERYMAFNYMPSDIDAFEISDLRETRPSANVIVVRYAVSAIATTPDTGMVMSADKAPRLTVFRWNEERKRWLVVSHANFNTPVAAICSQKPVTYTELMSPADQQQQYLGEDLVQKWFDLLAREQGELMLNPQVQSQTAGGDGYTTISERKRITVTSRERDGYVVTQHEGLMVISVYLRVTEANYMGTQLGTTKNPLVLTFQQEDDGMWLLIAIAIFCPPKVLPKDVACIDAGQTEQSL